jgi:hypothetical protein
MLKRDFLKKLAMLSSAATVGLAADSNPAEASQADPLTGVWEMTVTGAAGAYKYIYSISNGAWVASGNIDEGFQGFKYGPTLGSYVRRADGTYRYSERGWVFDMKGNNVGSFQSVGTFRLGADQKSLAGPGTFTQLDLHGKTIVEERFTAKATKFPD